VGTTIPNVFHAAANRSAALFMRFAFGSVARIHVLRAENASAPGGLLLASNHISHFDPLIISGVVRRKIDWMAMSEFFPVPVVGLFLRAVDAFPADRDRANRATIRNALQRLRSGRIVGIFPEGGIRDGDRSILQGAAVRPGVATLSDMAGVPILPCVILGTDRLYNKSHWVPLRRISIWIAFGDLIPTKSDGDKSGAREKTEQAFAAALTRLSRELQQTFNLTEADMPHPPRERMKE
jgi:1-acyl-sn-glycerol-3-phosphate acyltransferase